MQYDVNSHTRLELNRQWVLDILNKEIGEKVNILNNFALLFYKFQVVKQLEECQ